MRSRNPADKQQSDKADEDNRASFTVAARGKFKGLPEQTYKADDECDAARQFTLAYASQLGGNVPNVIVTRVDG